MISEMALQEGIIWDEVDMGLVREALAELEYPWAISLYGVVAEIALELASQMMRQDPTGYAEFLDLLGPNLFTATYSGPMWSPRLMVHGGVLVRNFHRVQGFDYVGFVRLPSLDGALADLERIKDAIPVLVEDESKRYYHFWMLNAVDEEVVSDLNFSRLNRCGNCLVGIAHIDALAACDVLTTALLGEALRSGRGGIALRFFEGGVSVYRANRWADSLDYITDHLYVGRYDRHEDALSSSRHNEVASSADICGTSPSGGAAWKRRRAVLRRKLLETCDAELSEVTQRFAEAPDSPLSERVPQTQQTGLELFLERVVDFMLEGVEESGLPIDSGSHNECGAPIFSGSPRWTAGAGQAFFGAEDNAAWQAAPTNPVTLTFSLPPDWSADVFQRLADPAGLLALVARHGFDTRTASVMLCLPACAEPEEWRALGAAALVEFLRRAGEIRDAGGPAPGERCLRIRCDVPMGTLLDLLELGSQLSASLCGPEREPQAPVLGRSMTMSLAPFGLSQSFVAGRAAAGNLT